MYKVIESDWKLFKNKLPLWQENFMDKLVKEYMQLLQEDKLASEKFWELAQRIKKDRKCVGVIATMSRSKMFLNILSLLNEGAITYNDLKDFSAELQYNIKTILDLNEK